jgi:hypothetical protein
MRRVFAVHRPATEGSERGNVEAVFTSEARAKEYAEACDIFPHEIFVLVLDPALKTWPIPEKK